MEQANNLVRENLIFLLQNMDIDLVQRISDFAYGVLSSPQNQEHDWWDDLTPEHQEELKAKAEAIENGTAETVSDDVVRDRIQKLIESKKEQK